jgi:branched-chain amino acid transport system permease protein
LLLVLIWYWGPRINDQNKDDPFASYANVVLLVGINIILAISLQLINGLSGQFSLGHAGFMALGAYVAGYATEACSVDPATPDGDRMINPGGVALFCAALIGCLLAIGLVLWGLYALLRVSARAHRNLPAILGLVLGIWFIADLCAADNYGPHWWLVWDQFISGIQKLYASIMDGGATAAMHLSSYVAPGWRRPVILSLELCMAAIVAGAAGLLIGLPTLRLRGDYLAIATLGFGEIIRVAITNCQALGGATGLSVTPYSDFNPDTHVQEHFISRWILGLALVVTLLVWRLCRSPRGRAIAAVRDDEIAAAAVGINTTRQKVTAFVVGAALAGVGGALYAHQMPNFNPTISGFMKSVELVVIVTLAGLGNIWWTLVIAMALTCLSEVLRVLGDRFNYRGLSTWTLVIYALLLIGVPILQATLWPRLRSRVHEIWKRNSSKAPHVHAGL